MMFFSVGAAAEPHLQIAPLGYRVEHLSAVPIQSRIHDLTARASVANDSAKARTLAAQFSSAPAPVEVLDGYTVYGVALPAAPRRAKLGAETFYVDTHARERHTLSELRSFLRAAIRAHDWKLECANCEENGQSRVESL